MIRPPLPPQTVKKPAQSLSARLESLIAGIEDAENRVKAGNTVDMRPLDAESIAIHKLLQGAKNQDIQPLLARTITALERLTLALEQQVEQLKSGNNKK